MDNASKEEMLLRLVEHPEQFTDEEKQRLLSDDECRKMYDMMVETRQSADYARSASEPLMPNIDSEWQRFSKENIRPKAGNRKWLQIAAATAGIVIVSGLAYASVALLSPKGTFTGDKGHVYDTETAPLATVNDTVTTAKADTTTVRRTVFDNAELQDIMAELSRAYGIKVVYAKESLRHVRLYLQLSPDKGLDGAIELINHFEKVHLRLDGNTVTVE